MLTSHLNKKLSELIPSGEKFAIAYSGGGDSTALVHALKDYPQAEFVYIVDHNLRSGSAAEAVAAEQLAVNFGYKVKLLKWEHKSPSTALQEKARQARYSLMGDQCRHDGVKYLLTAHSQDDQAETLLMRYERKTDWRGAAGMPELSYGPVWPALAMITIVRPVLEISRSELREHNQAHKINWAEDPSNQNRNFARIRARDYLKTRPELKTELLETAKEMRSFLDTEKQYLREERAEFAKIGDDGIITLTKPPKAELMFHCLRAASGQGKMIDRSKIKKLLFKMSRADFASATLGGALVGKYKDKFVICRDPVAAKGRQDSHHQSLKNAPNLLKMPIHQNPQIWDGRFLVTGPERGSYLDSLLKSYEGLEPDHRRLLKTIPTAARVTLPVLMDNGEVAAIGHHQSNTHKVQSLVKMRLEAALGGRVS